MGGQRAEQAPGRGPGTGDRAARVRAGVSAGKPAGPEVETRESSEEASETSLAEPQPGQGGQGEVWKLFNTREGLVVRTVLTLLPVRRFISQNHGDRFPQVELCSLP